MRGLQSVQIRAIRRLPLRRWLLKLLLLLLFVCLCFTTARRSDEEFFRIEACIRLLLGCAHGLSSVPTLDLLSLDLDLTPRKAATTTPPLLPRAPCVSYTTRHRPTAHFSTFVPLQASRCTPCLPRLYTSQRCSPACSCNLPIWSVPDLQERPAATVVHTTPLRDSRMGRVSG